MNEDAYWEYRREEWDEFLSIGPGRRDGDEAVYESGTVFLDGVVDEVEARKGCVMAELQEFELLEILQKMKGIVAESASWDDCMWAIDYKIKIA